MDAFSEQLNELLERSYRSVQTIEQEMLSALSGQSLTISEMHIIEAIGKRGPEGMTVTDIAAAQGVSVPSMTVAVQKLERKGYVSKEKSAADGRRVNVNLTQAGHRADISHRYFHRQMVRSVGKSVPPEEREALLRGIRLLNEFFEAKLRQWASGEDGGRGI